MAELSAKNLPKWLLWFSAASLFGFSAAFFVRPTSMASTVEIEAASAIARIEIRAMYGGLQMGLALFVAWCALRPERWRPGLLASLLAFAGLAIGRVAGIALAGGTVGIHAPLLAAETLASALSLWGLRLLGPYQSSG